MKLSLVILAWGWSLAFAAFLLSGHPTVWESLQRDIQQSGVNAVTETLYPCEDNDRCHKRLDDFLGKIKP